jgi:hypothetical protein
LFYVLEGIIFLTINSILLAVCIPLAKEFLNELVISSDIYNFEIIKYSSLLIISTILIYGFIAISSLICFANIIYSGNIIDLREGK